MAIILIYMTYLFLYIVGIILILYIYKVGWFVALKTVVSVIVPSITIVLFNVKAGRLLFRNPLVGIISALPTSIFIYRSTKPLVFIINDWLELESDGLYNIYIDRNENLFFGFKLSNPVDVDTVNKLCKEWKKNNNFRKHYFEWISKFDDSGEGPLLFALY